jgi:hypothetical protein
MDAPTRVYSDAVERLDPLRKAADISQTGHHPDRDNRSPSLGRDIA